jgi:hypothetical protein
MPEANSFTHEGEDESTVAGRMAAAGYPFKGSSVARENIGWQSARGDAHHEDNVAQIHELLMSSPGHRDVILNPDVRDIGIGIEIGTVSGETGDYETVMVTQNFGATDADVSAWIDPGVAEPATEDKVVGEADAGDEDDIVMDELPEEETATDLPEPALSQTPLPFGLEHFTVDLSSAFEFRMEGDQMIWEASEDKLVEAFLATLTDWAGVPDQTDNDVIDLSAEDEDASLADLPPEDMPRLPLEPAQANETDETEDFDLVS